MRQNIAIALTTVSLLLLGVLLGGVTMAIGMLVHEISVLVVIVNAMRLLRRTHQRSTPVALIPAAKDVRHLLVDRRIHLARTRSRNRWNTDVRSVRGKSEKVRTHHG